MKLIKQALQLTNTSLICYDYHRYAHKIYVLVTTLQARSSMSCFLPGKRTNKRLHYL